MKNLNRFPFYFNLFYFLFVVIRFRWSLSAFLQLDRMIGTLYKKKSEAHSLVQCRTRLLFPCYANSRTKLVPRPHRSQHKMNNKTHAMVAAHHGKRVNCPICVLLGVFVGINMENIPCLSPIAICGSQGCELSSICLAEQSMREPFNYKPIFTDQWIDDVWYNIERLDIIHKQ